MYVGLADGTLVLLDACDPAPSPRHTVMVGTGPVRGCVCVMGQLWVACGGSLFCLDQTTFDLKVRGGKEGWEGGRRGGEERESGKE